MSVTRFSRPHPDSATCSRRVALAAAAAALFAPAAALAQDPWPSKPIKVVVPFPAGTSPDVIARQWAEKMRQLLGQTLVIDNRPGAATIIGAQAAVMAPADGYTLLYTAQNTMSINPFVYRNLSYKPDDFVPVHHVCDVPLVLITSAQSPIKSLQDLVRAAKEQPGKLNYASYGIGQGTHVAMARLLNTANVQMVHVPYKDGGLNDVMGGAVNVSFEASTSAIPQIQGGKVRALAVSSPRRLEQLPDVPNVGEMIHGFVADSWHGVFVRKGTPQAVIDKLAGASQKVVLMEDFRKRLRDVALQPAGGTPADFVKFLAEDAAAWSKVVRDNAISVDN